MTTREFIERTYNTESTKERRCSSVFTDHHGQVYSYGLHYPLAFNVKSLDLVNVRGYSSTTSKHIRWARRALGNAIDVNISHADARVISSFYATPDDKLHVILKALELEIKGLIELRDSKKRKDTAVYYAIENGLARARANYSRVKEVE